MTSRASIAVAVALTAAIGAAVLPAVAIVPDLSQKEPPIPKFAGPTVTAMGLAFPSAPAAAPARPNPDAKPPTIAEIRSHMAAADTTSALAAATELVEKRRWGHDRDAAWLLIGMLHREEGRHNLASEAFTKVRLSKGPLAPWGAYYEAEQDFRRGKPSVAISECKKYEETWPEGRFVQDCKRIIAQSWAAQGHAYSAKQVAEEYDEEHEGAEITEHILLVVAEYYVSHDRQAEAIPILQKLSHTHVAPLTGRVANEHLGRLHAAGFAEAALPTDTPTLKKRAMSLRDSGRRHDAMALFDELMRRAPDDPRLGRWVEQEADRFGWRARDYGFLADYYRARYEAEGDAEDLWLLHRVLSRDGKHAESLAVAEQGLTDHPGNRHWRRREEDIARTAMMAGDYVRARELMDTRAKRGGWSGRRAGFYAAFSAFMAGDHADALARFDTIIDRDRSYVTESHYWRARTLAALERAPEAEADRQWIQAEDPWSWYALLLEQDDTTRPRSAPFGRNGAWPGAALPDLPPAPDAVEVGQPALAAWVPPRRLTGSVGFARMAWPLQAAIPSPAAPEPSVAIDDLTRPPESYLASQLFNPWDAFRDLDELADKNTEQWPELQVIHELARIGLYDQSGPLMAEMHEDWRKAIRSPRDPRYQSARDMKLKQDDWEQLFLVTRDHHHTMRYMYGKQDDFVEGSGSALEAHRLGWPLAHDRFVWAHSREADIDPMLVLGLMRQESQYSPIATSRVGARGAMQIMPRTGNLLADQFGDKDFSAADLEDPVLAVGYGLHYLGLLMDRFEGVYPLAIASYNGGPHNVSSWLDGTGHDMPMDQWVEHIPFRETRGYVKTVSANYRTYLALYAPDGTLVDLPPHPTGNHETVVDF